MLIYIHFLKFTGKDAIKIFNVDSIQEIGENAIRVKMQFSDNKPEFVDVRHVAVNWV